MASRNFTAKSDSLPDDTAGEEARVMILAFPAAMEDGSTTVVSTVPNIVEGPAAGIFMLPGPTTAVVASMAASQASANLVTPAKALGVGANASSLASNVDFENGKANPTGVMAAGLVVIAAILSAYQLAKFLAHELSFVLGSASKVVCHFDKGSMAIRCRL